MKKTTPAFGDVFMTVDDLNRKLRLCLKMGVLKKTDVVAVMSPSSQGKRKRAWSVGLCCQNSLYMPPMGLKPTAKVPMTGIGFVRGNQEDLVENLDLPDAPMWTAPAGLNRGKI